MSDDVQLSEKRAIRARALRAAQAVAIVATLVGAGCSTRTEAPATDAGQDATIADLGTPDTGVADSGLADLGAEDSSVVDLGVADLGAADLGVVDSGLLDSGIDAALADAETPIDVDAETGNPCINDAGSVDFECCAAMGYPSGCPVIGPFIPPSMNTV